MREGGRGGRSGVAEGVFVVASSTSAASSSAASSATTAAASTAAAAAAAASAASAAAAAAALVATSSSSAPSPSLPFSRPASFLSGSILALSRHRSERSTSCRRRRRWAARKKKRRRRGASACRRCMAIRTTSSSSGAARIRDGGTHPFSILSSSQASGCRQGIKLARKRSTKVEMVGNSRGEQTIRFRCFCFFEKAKTETRKKVLSIFFLHSSFSPRTRLLFLSRVFSIFSLSSSSFRRGGHRGGRRGRKEGCGRRGGGGG